jgi:hypothetical protein
MLSCPRGAVVNVDGEKFQEAQRGSIKSAGDERRYCLAQLRGRWGRNKPAA